MIPKPARRTAIADLLVRAIQRLAVPLAMEIAARSTNESIGLSGSSMKFCASCAG
jgi:hypothetical protein